MRDLWLLWHTYDPIFQTVRDPVRRADARLRRSDPFPIRRHMNAVPQDRRAAVPISVVQNWTEKLTQ